ncbi:MAG: hypothetical protein S0880_37155 [Actinomycetota bacterium]|nr:hypothetical protein [Actinomycetota bacterium]
MSNRNRALAALAAAVVLVVIAVALWGGNDGTDEATPTTGTSTTTTVSTSTTATTVPTTSTTSTSTTSTTTTTAPTTTTTTVPTTTAPPTTAGPVADEASLRSAVATFVDTSQPYATRAQHLEDGPALENVVRQFEVFAPSLAVTGVDVAGDRATFTFDASGVSASAEAVFAGGRWQITRESFCALVAFVGTPCPA